MDRVLYKSAVRQALEAQDGLVIFQQSVEDLIVQGDRIGGVRTQLGLEFESPCVVLTVGTFLGGLIHVGDRNYQGGRASDAPSNPLAQRLRELPFRVGRAVRLLGTPLTAPETLAALLRRPQVGYRALMAVPGAGPGVGDDAVAEQIEIQARYSGYIDRQEQEIARNCAHEDTPLAADLDYASVRGLSTEVVQKLSSFRPVTLGQAARISGVTPAAISLLRVHLKRRSAA
jgi:tRNA U34 5-carboxymethylaminomethyl modifying enzyme MnmG/GidA